MRRLGIKTVKERKTCNRYLRFVCMCVAVFNLAWVGFGMRSPTHAASAPVFEELQEIPRHEITDMRSREEWVEPEPVWVNPLSQYEMDLFAALVWAEAGDQPLPDGLCYVADVVLNRLDRGWASSIEGVIYQPGQFSVVTDGALNRAYGNAPQVAYDAIISQLQNRWRYDIIYFSMGYNANGNVAFVHGTHYYST